MPYLLDTNAWIDYLKQAASPIHARLAALQPGDVVTCSIVRSELLHGAEKYGNRDRRVAKVEQTLAPYRSVAFDDVDAVEYARIRHELEIGGNVIGPYDLQIAAICVRHGFTSKLIGVTDTLSAAGPADSRSRLVSLLKNLRIDWLNEKTVWLRSRHIGL